MRVRLAGIVAFNPPIDWTKSREERDGRNPIARKKYMVRLGIFGLFDESYLLRLLLLPPLMRVRARVGVRLVWHSLFYRLVLYRMS
jgi:hypothetical protein